MCLHILYSKPWAWSWSQKVEIWVTLHSLITLNVMAPDVDGTNVAHQRGDSCSPPDIPRMLGLKSHIFWDKYYIQSKVHVSAAVLLWRFLWSPAELHVESACPALGSHGLKGLYDEIWGWSVIVGVNFCSLKDIPRGLYFDFMPPLPHLVSG
jgi:hypothetical protein